MLKRVRKQKRMSQKNLAEKLGVTQSYISQLEKDRYKNVGTDLIRKISTVLEVDPVDLFLYFYDKM